MSDRGIKKWAPYKTLSEQDFTLKNHKEKEERIEKPIVSNELAEEINEILVNYHGECLNIKYYKNGKVLEYKGIIKKIDTYERKLVLVPKRTIMISEIVSIEIEEGDMYEENY